MTAEELKTKITAKFPTITEDAVPVKTYPTYRISDVKDVPSVLQWLGKEAGCDYLHMVSAVDYLGPLNLDGFIREPNHNFFLPDGATPQITPPVKAADYPYRDAVEIQYAVMNLTDKLTIFLKADVPRTGGEAPSIIREFPSADWQEREIYDLFGVRFAGHPNMTKILTPDFLEGHPLRKDYVHKKDKFD